MILVIMGVSGSGKTTLGQQLAKVLGWQFIEGDDFHPPVNVTKMRSGIPLTDNDRGPWLTLLRGEIDQILQQKTSAVIACSALKQHYRAVLQGAGTDNIRFVYLQGQPETLRSRLAQRQGHFMKAAMLESQLATLEVPEAAIVVNVDRDESVEALVADLLDRLKQTEAVAL